MAIPRAIDLKLDKDFWLGMAVRRKRSEICHHVVLFVRLTSFQLSRSCSGALLCEPVHTSTNKIVL